LAAGRWQRGLVWLDTRVDDERLLLLSDPAGLEGRPVVIRSLAVRRSGLARVERSDTGSQGHVHPALARLLGANDERFEAEWRRARWYDVVWLNRIKVAAVVLAALASATAALLALADTAKKVGWVIAVLVLFIGVCALVLTVRVEFDKFKP
jgi:hypothetical protein